MSSIPQSLLRSPRLNLTSSEHEVGQQSRCRTDSYKVSFGFSPAEYLHIHRKIEFEICCQGYGLITLNITETSYDSIEDVSTLEFVSSLGHYRFWQLQVLSSRRYGLFTDAHNLRPFEKLPVSHSSSSKYNA